LIDSTRLIGPGYFLLAVGLLAGLYAIMDWRSHRQLNGSSVSWDPDALTKAALLIFTIGTVIGLLLIFGYYWNKLLSGH